jgi:hypothetical protein
VNVFSRSPLEHSRFESWPHFLHESHAVAVHCGKVCRAELRPLLFPLRVNSLVIQTWTTMSTAFSAWKVRQSVGSLARRLKANAASGL